jgi:uncharacterized protein (DUF2062 family)
VVFSWRRVRARLVEVLHVEDESPRRLAAAMAVGVFIGITPVYGLHTLLALLVAWAVRLNPAVTVTGAWLNLPWFAPFVYGFCLALGEAFLTWDFRRFSFQSLADLAAGAGSYLRSSPSEHAGTFLQLLWDMLFAASLPLFVGTTVVGLVLGLVAYAITLEAVRDVRRLRQRRHLHGHHDHGHHEPGAGSRPDASRPAPADAAAAGEDRRG